MNCNNIYIYIKELYDRLKPLCRSITGIGYERSLRILSDYIPFEWDEYKSGTKVLDWQVPPTWIYRSAKLTALNSREDAAGEVVLDSKITPMCLLNYSVPFYGVVSRQELEPHLFTLPKQPDNTPYVTSYYKANWGFCLSEIQKRSLKAPFYRVQIDTMLCGDIQSALESGDLKPEEAIRGGVIAGDCILRGETEKTILISSYLCHPSMLNNELSGPLTQVLLYQKLKALKRRYFTYRFVIFPETIGSIAFLSRHADELKKHLEYGMVLTCLAAKFSEPCKKFSFKLTRQDWIVGLKAKFGRSEEPYLIDKLLRELSSYGNIELRDFTPSGGSDERQFCSAGMNLPVVQASRTVYGTYPEYHTLADNEALFDIKTIDHAANFIFKILGLYRIYNRPVRSEIAKNGGGEPQLGKRGLYPDLNLPQAGHFDKGTNGSKPNMLDVIMRFLNLADGSFTFAEIAKALNINPIDLFDVVNLLQEKEIIEPSW